MMQQLLDTGIVVESADGLYELSAEFEETLSRVTSATSQEPAASELALENAAPTDELAVLEDHEEYSAIYSALDAALDTATHVQKLQLIPLINAFHGSGVELDGVPEYFYPVPGDLLNHLLSHYKRAIVYVWRHDCPPCRTVKADFETFFEQPPTDIALFAVYGPEWASLLQEQFDITGGPATLFIVNGEVDARLYGAHPRDTLRNELETLREIPATD